MSWNSSSNLKILLHFTASVWGGWTCGHQRTTGKSCCSPLTTWVPGTEGELSCLAARIFASWAISLARIVLIKKNIATKTSPWEYLNHANSSGKMVAAGKVPLSCQCSLKLATGFSSKPSAFWEEQTRKSTSSLLQPSSKSNALRFKLVLKSS